MSLTDITSVQANTGAPISVARLESDPNISDEIWRSIEAYPAFEVSSKGRICCFRTNGAAYRGEPIIYERHILKPHPHSNGYSFAAICKNGKAKSLTIHRLVAKAFIPNPENKPQVNHINGIKTDNRIENLEWATPKENRANVTARLGNFAPRGEQAGGAKLTEEKVRKIRREYAEGLKTYRQLAYEHKVTDVAIGKIIRRRSWAHVL